MIMEYFVQYVVCTKEILENITVGLNMIVPNLKMSQVIQSELLLEGLLVGLYCWFLSSLFTMSGSTEGLIRPDNQCQPIITWILRKILITEKRSMDRIIFPRFNTTQHSLILVFLTPVKNITIRQTLSPKLISNRLIPSHHISNLTSNLLLIICNQLFLTNDFYQNFPFLKLLSKVKKFFKVFDIKLKIFNNSKNI